MTVQEFQNKYHKYCTQDADAARAERDKLAGKVTDSRGLNVRIVAVRCGKVGCALMLETAFFVAAAMTDGMELL